LAVQFLNEAWCSLANRFSAGRQFSAKNPRLRQARNPYAIWRKPTIEMKKYCKWK